LRTAGRFSDVIAGVITLDSPIRTVAPEEEAAFQQSAFGPLRVYADREEIIKRFRPIPGQESLPYIRSYIAENSIREVDGGWSWKFDPKIFGQGILAPATLMGLTCRLAMFRAEYGMVAEEMIQTVRDQIGGVALVIDIPDAGHAVMLDQPLALVTGLRTLLAEWEQII
jgi:pimeloyl-ACP methyl ester carboxylesterase